MRRLRRAIALTLLALSAAAPLRAQPAAPLTLVAPAAPGGGWDQTARAMQRVLRTTVLVALG